MTILLHYYILMNDFLVYTHQAYKERGAVIVLIISIETGFDY